MMTRIVPIPSADGTPFSGYLALPEGEPTCAVVLLQEIFGINANMRWTAELFASQGVAVLVPDLFWRLSPGIDLNPADPDQRAKAMDLSAGFDVDFGLRDCVAAADWLREETGKSKVGTIGYCLGGRLAFLLAARGAVDAAAAFYPVAIHADLAATAPGNAPLMIHLAGDDALCSPSAQADICAFMAGWDRGAVMTHARLGHGFARIGRTGPAEAAALAAEAATVRFLESQLG